ncbi:hypothetical protein [Desulfonatronospira sp.]|uniref:hypothetical protein n=1 Tax=Desulfonatronospira sp. TaxID=1962951 RepID=UPI0025BF6209|nr:hypothetical protein [Desulfonatronospira sp.]
MNRQELIQKASEIKAPSAQTASEFQEAVPQIVAELNQIMCSRSDLEKLTGVNSREMMLDNHNNHARFLSALLVNYRPEVLVDTVFWVLRTYQAHGFQPAYWPAQLNAWIQLLQKHLSPGAYEEISQIYNFIIVNLAYLDSNHSGGADTGPGTVPATFF